MVIDIFETKNTNDFNIKKYEKFYEDLKQVFFDEQWRFMPWNALDNKIK